MRPPALPGGASEIGPRVLTAAADGCMQILSFHGAAIFGPKCGAAERPLLKAWPLPQDVCETSLAVAERSDSMALLYTADGILSVGTAPDDMKVPRWLNGEGPATGSGDTIGEWWVKAGEFPVPVVG